MPETRLSICPLASGSRGNAVLVSGGSSSILIDAGLSGVELEKRMRLRGITPDTLTAIVITHEHNDHVQSAGVLSRRFNIPVYITQKTCRAASSKLGRLDHVRHFECGVSFKIGNIAIKPFSISHDAEDPVGLTLEHQSAKIGIATDMGVVTTLVKEHLKGCAILYVEANHDSDMLINGPYPWYLKQRVKGRTGHLSNLDTREMLTEIRSKDLRHVILAHLSQQNNTPDMAFRTVGECLDTACTTLTVASPDHPGEIISI
ncbi:MAG: MBL fold metallo-hydrolase [Pseudomonadota bacterium]